MVSLLRLDDSVGMTGTGEPTEETPDYTPAVCAVSKQNELYFFSKEDTDFVDGDGSRKRSKTKLNKKKNKKKDRILQSLSSPQEVTLKKKGWEAEAAENLSKNKETLNKRVTLNKIHPEKPAPPKIVKIKRSEKKRRKSNEASTHSAAKDLHNSSESKIHQLEMENKSLKQEIDHLRKILTIYDTVSRSLMVKDEMKTTADENKTDEMPKELDQDKLDAQKDVADSTKQCKTSSPSANKAEREETHYINEMMPQYFHTTGSDKVLVPQALLVAHPSESKREGDDTATTATTGDEFNSVVMKTNEPKYYLTTSNELSSSAIKGDRISSIEEEKGFVNNLSCIKSFAFDLADVQMDRKYTEATINILKGQLDAIASLMLNIRIAQDKFYTIKKAGTKETSKLEGARLQKSQRLKEDVAVLQGIFERASKKAMSLEKYLKEIESNHDNLKKEKKDILKRHAEDTKEHQRQIGALKEKIRTIHEEHKQEKEGILESHTKEIEDYKQRLLELKKALKKMVKQKKDMRSSIVEAEHESNSSKFESRRSIKKDYRLSIVKMHYENKIQGLEAQQMDEVKGLHDGTRKLKKLV